METINDIPVCPQSFTSPDSRVMWIDLCQHLIKQGKLTLQTLETIKHCITINEVFEIADREQLNNGFVIQGELSPWARLHKPMSERLLECSELLGLTPKDLGLI